MALLSTLRYGSASAQPPGLNNYGGDLHLFFTKLSSDLKQNGTLDWAGWAIGNIYTLPNGTLIRVNLNVVSDGGPPLYLVPVGDISVQTGEGKDLGGARIGNGGQVFTPDTPVTTLFNGSQSGTTPDGILFTVGFEMIVAWDGISADSHGSWWAIWH